MLKRREKKITTEEEEGPWESEMIQATKTIGQKELSSSVPRAFFVMIVVLPLLYHHICLVDIVFRKQATMRFIVAGMKL